jgi:hypothetical protein
VSTCEFVAQTQVPEILARYRKPSRVHQLDPDTSDPLILFDRLVSDGELAMAVEFLAHWMPAQQGVWWGCLCIWEVERQKDDKGLNPAMQLILRWLRTPSADSRQATQQIRQWFTKRDPIYLLSQAIQTTGPSLTAEHLPPVKPPDHLFCKLVYVSVMVTASRMPPAERNSNLKQLLRFGMEVLQGANHWEERA